ERVTIGNLFRLCSQSLIIHYGDGCVKLRRLFSTFARGWPGTGLLLLRLAAGSALISSAFIRLTTLDLVAIAVGVLLIAGRWTAVARVITALVGLWNACYAQFGDPWANGLGVCIGISLAMVGPGAWSVDRWLFGWKRIDVGDRGG